MELNLIEKYSNLFGVSSCESEVLANLKNDMPEVDEIYVDALSNAYFKLGNTGPKIMIAAHMDEVGFIVQSIASNGMINILPVGGIDPVITEGIQIVFNNETKNVAVIKTKLADKRAGDDFITADAGFSSKEEVLAAGIKVADFATFKNNFTKLNDKTVCGKALDDRYGIVMLIELAKYFKDNPVNAQLYFSATTQEELGLRGAGQLATKINPEYAIVLDVSNASETEEDMGFIGQGALIRNKDPRAINNQTMKRILRRIAELNEVKTQEFFSKGSTDATAIQTTREGVAVVNIGICGRYIHTANTIISIDDYDQSLKLTKLMITTLTNEE